MAALTTQIITLIKQLSPASYFLYFLICCSRWVWKSFPTNKVSVAILSRLGDFGLILTGLCVQPDFVFFEIGTNDICDGENPSVFCLVTAHRMVDLAKWVVVRELRDFWFKFFQKHQIWLICPLWHTVSIFAGRQDERPLAGRHFEKKTRWPPLQPKHV